VSLHTHTAANDHTIEPLNDIERTDSHGTVNPLWMITAALGFFLTLMAILIVS
jgi:hypothetical protein